MTFGLLIFAIIAGEVIKLPVSGLAGITLLDLGVFLLSLVGLISLKLKLTSPPLFIKAGMAFILWGTITLLLNPLSLSLNQIGPSLLYGLRFSGYLLFSWILLSGGLKSIQSKWIFILIWSSLGLAILGLLQLIFIPNLSFLASQGWDPHYFRTVSTLLDPNFLATFLNLNLILLTLILFFPSQFAKFNKTFLKVAFGIIYLAELTTFSRSSALMFGVSFLVLSVITKSRQILILTILLGLGFGISFLGYHQFIAQPHNIDRSQSAAYRLNSWQEGLNIFGHSPIFGVGFNSYKYALDKYQLVSGSYLNSRGSTSNDSSLLFVADTTGIIGLVIYLIFLGALAWQKNKLILAGLAGLIVDSLFINSLFYPWILIWLGLVAGSKQ